jgi:nicotinamidase-related amidase
VRRYLTYPPAGVPSEEANNRYEEKNLVVDSNQMALILVDCWDENDINQTFLRRAADIVRAVIVPFAEFCRRAGILVIHAPSLSVAGRYVEWMENPEDWDRNPPQPVWPPEDFRNRTGEHAELAWSLTPVLEDWYDYMENRMMIMSEIEPVQGDLVVATGDQLHALLSRKRILHLLYAGFATNMCVPNKDYGMRAMISQGYHAVLLRDTTTAVESHETYKTELLKTTAITNTETGRGFSATCDTVREAFEVAAVVAAAAT